MLTPDIIARSDVLYCTRVQKERFPSLEEYERLKDSFVVDNGVLKHAKSTMVLMHPLPRNREISEEVDFDQRAAYFRQVSLRDDLSPFFFGRFHFRLFEESFRFRSQPFFRGKYQN